MSTSALLWSWLFGSVGLALFVYGKRQKVGIPLVCGLALMIFPYFTANPLLLVAVGVALVVSQVFT